MAVPEQTPYSEHTGNGSTTSFALGFQCETKDHLIVLVDDVEPPIATWSLNSGNVVFTTAPAAGKKITVQRNTPFGRTTNYQSFNNSFRPQTVNGDFDRIWWKLQELGIADWILGARIDALKNYVDQKDDELKAYLMEEIRKQGVALDQLDEYYNYLMERLAQIAVDKGWDASFVVDASGLVQQEINDLSGHSRLMFKDYADLRKYSGLGTRIFVSNKWLRGSFIYDSSDTSSEDNDGTIIVDSKGRRWKREFNGAVKAYWFGAPTGVNDQVQINKAIIAAVGHKELVDFRGASWRINGPIVFNEVSSGFISDKNSSITVQNNGVYPKGYAIEIGDPSKPFNSGRVVQFKAQGHLNVWSTSGATNEVHGVYIKGAHLSVDFIRATQFNGTGINCDSIYDSTIRHLSVELCGNSTNYALRLSSTGDTFNASTINAIQCEQSRERGLNINVIRTTINTIHAERMTLTDSSQVHNYINLGNSTINQAIIDSRTRDETTEINAAASVVSSINCSGSVRTTSGTSQTLDNLICTNYSSSGSAKNISLNNCRIFDTLKPSEDFVITNSIIGTFNPQYNAMDISVIGGSITTLNCTSNIRGNINLYNVKIDTIRETKEPSAGYNQMEFFGCNVSTYYGAFNAKSKFIGGSIQTAAVVSQAKPTFESVVFKDFNPTGVRAYITRNCTATGAVSWGLPSVNFSAGTITERLGYDPAGKIYQNTDSAANWAKLA